MLAFNALPQHASFLVLDIFVRLRALALDVAAILEKARKILVFFKPSEFCLPALLSVVFVYQLELTAGPEALATSARLALVLLLVVELAYSAGVIELYLDQFVYSFDCALVGNAFGFVVIEDEEFWVEADIGADVVREQAADLFASEFISNGEIFFFLYRF